MHCMGIAVVVAVVAPGAAPPATIDAADVKPPRRLFARIDFTSEMAPCAIRANAAVAGMKLITVSAIGATFLSTLPIVEKNPGFLHEEEASSRFPPTVNLSVYEPTLSW